MVAVAAHDRRWEKIQRPVVVVGGELTLEMLDLTFNPISKFYEAPIQMKANGGVFVVDDFGRQRIAPRDLLNRWIVPLESRVDFLTLHTGRKFEIPFNVLIVFATNLKPESLADEAFLRRIPYKILAKNPTLDESLPHLRAELPQAQHRVRSGDGRIPAAQVLPAAQAADARLPPARPGRAGGEQLPLSGPRAGHHARAARRGVRELFPRRERVPGGRSMSQSSSVAVGRLASRTAALDPSPVRAGAAARTSLEPAEILSRMVIVAMFTILAVRLGMDFLQTAPVHRAAAARLGSARRGAHGLPPADRRSRSQHARPAADGGVAGRADAGPAGRDRGLRRRSRHRVARGDRLVIVIAGKVSLGRSFGLMPANRGVVSSGLYRLVRHPIYMGYLITHVGFVLANGTFGNIAIFLGADITLMIRAVYEERVLARDSAYREYQSKVRWRVLPGLF